MTNDIDREALFAKVSDLERLCRERLSSENMTALIDADDYNEMLFQLARCDITF